EQDQRDACSQADKDEDGDPPPWWCKAVEHGQERTQCQRNHDRKGDGASGNQIDHGNVTSINLSLYGSHLLTLIFCPRRKIKKNLPSASTSKSLLVFGDWRRSRVKLCSTSARVKLPASR